MKADISQHKDNQKCEKCGQVVLLNRYCSLECLRDLAEKEGKPIEAALEEMYNDAIEVQKLLKGKKD